MRVLIVDDEPAARSRLAAMLDELDVEVVGEADNGIVAIAKATETKPDLVLLDIVMPEVDGFDVVRHLSEPRPLIIFQTAHDEHALRAFEHEAVDYVVKPITLDRLERALDRARRRLAGAETGSLARGVIERLEQALAAASLPQRARLLVRDRGAHRLLPFAQITRFTTSDGLVFAHMPTGRFLVDYTLDELEVRAGPAFVRCSRSDLVQLDRIARFAPNTDGSATVTLDDGTRVRVSRRRTPALRRTMEG